MGRLDGKRMVITGSSRSLGRHFALACAAQGASLVINGTSEAALAQVEAELRKKGAPVRAVPGSVADSAVCRRLVETCVEAYGGIDVMVNNAGIVRDRTLLKMTDEEFDEVIAVDLRGPFLGMREAARAMKEQGGGHIIHITSASGLVGNFGQTNYAAAKAGLMGMMYTAVKELARSGVRVNAMWPVARTDMTQPIIDKAGKSARELGFGEPEDVALGLVWLASDAAGGFNGQCLTCNGVKTALWRSPREEHILQSDQPLTLEQLEAHYREVEPLPVYSTR
ncbi:MAG: SDR family NAD(P)-dependent oxidoreductase [Halioglobus sp.]|nr:SDR family NAD(P)-dependent oxidoreductase [Halioglobus sp.]